MESILGTASLLLLHKFNRIEPRSPNVLDILMNNNKSLWRHDVQKTKTKILKHRWNYPCAQWHLNIYCFALHVYCQVSVVKLSSTWSTFSLRVLVIFINNSLDWQLFVLSSRSSNSITLRIPYHFYEIIFLFGWHVLMLSEHESWIYSFFWCWCEYLLVLPLFHVSREYFALFALRIQFWILYNLYIFVRGCARKMLIQQSISTKNKERKRNKKYNNALTWVHICTTSQIDIH